MKRQKSQSSSIGTLGKAVVTATLLGYSALSPQVQAASTPQTVASGIYVTILSPAGAASDPTKQIEISAFYQAAVATGGVTTLELYIDGQQEAVKTLDTPDYRGVVSFVISPGTLTSGDHHVVVRVSTTDAEIASVQTNVSIAQPIAEDTKPQPALGGTTDDGSAPAVAIMTPSSNATVVGTVDIKVDAHDDSGKPPYVSLFIDHNFKTLRNYPPFDFAWDTTRVANGYHTIEVWGYNDDQAVGHAQPITVLVNNPSGRTLVRQDLLDTVPTKAVAKATAHAQHVRTAVQKPASLAYGTPVSAGKPLDKLASANVDDSNSSLSEQTQLMAPFLTERVEHISKSVSAPTVKSNPTLDSHIVSATTGNDEQLSVLATDDNGLVSATQLVEPKIESLVPSAPASRTGSGIALTAATSVEGVEMSPDVQLRPLSASSLTSLSPDIETSAPSVELEAVPPAEKPAKVPEHVAVPAGTLAVLATGGQANELTIGYTKIASASIDASSLFSPQTSLQAPTVLGRQVVNLISTRRVPTAAQPLGSSPAGFPAHDVVRMQVVINDRPVLLNQPLQDRKHFLFAPFRQIFESEGGVMSWSGASHQVHALNGSRDIELTIGSPTAIINQQPVTMNASPYLTDGHTMIPLAFVPIALNATVSYDPATGHVMINSNN